MKVSLNDCPFCSPEVEQFSWLETDKTRVIYNASPILPGHSLVLPKRHVSSLLELEDAELNELFQTARKAIFVLLQVFQGEGFDMSLQNGQAAGQTISHVHVHIFPRKFGDSLSDKNWHSQLLDSQSRPRLSDGMLISIVRKLRKEAIVILGKTS